jgi:serine/threonine protein kinase
MSRVHPIKELVDRLKRERNETKTHPSPLLDEGLTLQKKRTTGRILEHYVFTFSLFNTHYLQQLGEQIGKGQFGRVFKALNLKTGSFVAIKQIDMEYIPSKQIQEILVSN